MTNLSRKNLNKCEAAGPKGESRDCPRDFPRYPEYKDSGIEWLRYIPAHWGSKPLWTLFRRVKRTGYSDETLLSVYRDYGVIPKASRDDNYNKPSEDLNSYQLVKVGDLAINKMKAWQGSVAISEYRGIVSPAYHVYESRHQENARYLHYLFRSKEYISGYLANSKGIRVNQWDLEPQQHSRMPALLPPIREQETIASFLDHETARIDDLIDEQKRLIKLLKEKRQAVISHAVTRGLVPDAPMNDSGVEWLGEVPAHWAVARLKNLIETKGGSTPKKDRISDSIDHVSEDAVSETNLSMIQPGAILIVVRGMILDHSVPVAVSDSSLTINQDMKAILTGRNINNEFLHVLLKGIRDAIFEFVDTSAHGTKKLEWESFENMKIPLPPLKEQLRIVEQVSRISAMSEELSDEAERVIDILLERRSALISAGVTGKIDVRDWQPPGFSTQYSESAKSGAPA